MSRYFEAPDYYRPRPFDAPAVFLAGGITGVERWHDHAAATLAAAPERPLVLNPNRRNFPIDDPDAGIHQVAWEQHHLHLPSVITLMWFPASDPKVTTQPIAMFELGQALGEGRRIVVGADPGYPRRRDVHLLAGWVRPGIRIHSSLDAVLDAALAEVRASEAAKGAAITEAGRARGVTPAPPRARPTNPDGVPHA